MMRFALLSQLLRVGSKTAKGKRTPHTGHLQRRNKPQNLVPQRNEANARWDASDEICVREAEAQAERDRRELNRLQEERLLFAFRVTGCTKESQDILREAHAHGWDVGVHNTTIIVTKIGKGTTYLRSNRQIRDFGRSKNLQKFVGR
jgi:hypothetical protein